MFLDSQQHGNSSNGLGGGGGRRKMEAKEDFTLLNLSKSSSSLSDQSEELFKPESRRPKRKRRVKRRSTSQNHHSSSSSSNQTHASFSGSTSQQNIFYTVFIFLFCWIGTLTWLVFSLRNQLTDVTTRLEEASKLSKPFPDQLEQMNQSLLKLNSTIEEFRTRLNATQLALIMVEKTVNNTPTVTNELIEKEVQKSIASLGSTLMSQISDLEKDVKTLKSSSNNENDDVAAPSGTNTKTQPNTT